MLGAWVRNISLVFLAGLLLSGCGEKFTPEDYEQISIPELKRLENLDRETLSAEVSGKKVVFGGQASLYGYEQIFLLGELEITYDKDHYPIYFNCVQMLIPGKLFKNLQIGETDAYRFYGTFLTSGELYFDDGQFSNAMIMFYEIEGVQVKPYCARKNGLLFKVNQVERMQE